MALGLMLLRKIEFHDYKSFPRFDISARNRNVLVGPNNAGKSTTLDSLRIASDVLRYARRRNAVFKSQGEDGVCSTYTVPNTVIQSDLRYCVHNFSDAVARIELTGDNGNRFVMQLRPNEDVECYLVSDAPAQKNSAYLRNQFPAQILVVPTLSPLEQNEELVQFETVERNRFGRLASRNFRNFWLHQTQEEFERFADLVEFGWPGVRVRPPEIEHGDREIVRMYFREGPNVREVQWAGFGFQVWMQTMMHLLQAEGQSILVLDEPDIYLHPDLQHRLLRLVSDRVAQYFIATHSTEIINDADPGDVLIVRPKARSAKRIRSDGEYPEIYTAIGSSENAQFARLARTRKVLYFEGGDNKLLSKLAKHLGGIEYISDSAVTIMKTEGFANWSRVSTTSWVFNEFFEMEVSVAALFDRDYRCDDEVNLFLQDIQSSGALCYVLPFKEIENILLVPRAIKAVAQKFSQNDLPAADLDSIDVALGEILTDIRDDVLTKRISHKVEFELKRNPKKNVHSISSEEKDAFTELWKDEVARLRIVPGKYVFSQMAKFLQSKFGVTLTTSRLIDELTAVDVDPDLLGILGGIRDHFASS